MKKILLICGFLLISSCELPPIIQADQYVEPAPIVESNNAPVYENIWDRIRTSVPDTEEYLNEKTIRYINAYLKNPDQLDKLFEKGRYFIYFVLEELERYRLPPELALLPYIESNYDPFSISSSGAMGIWQFMPATARIVNIFIICFF